MAGARGRLHKATSSTAPRRSARRGKTSQEDIGVPNIFQEMLNEDQTAKMASADGDKRPLKKRKTTHIDTETGSTREQQSSNEPAVPRAPRAQSQVPSQTPSQSHAQLLSQTHTRVSVRDRANRGDEPMHERILQTVIDSDESDESDIEWEDALGEDRDAENHEISGDAEPEVGDISITIGGDGAEEKKMKKQIRRRAITSVEKKLRLDIHKMHILCLLYHVHRRNAWCNDERVQTTLRKIPPVKILSNLVPNPELSQYQASKRFMDGMKDLKMLWSKRFTVNAQGMYKPRWASTDADTRPFSDFDELDDPMDRGDFRRAAHTLQGSQDVGAQLFCALLRGLGLDARLVCSLQCLPFASAAQPSPSQKSSPQKSIVVLDPYNKKEDPSPSKPKATPLRPKKLSRLERIIGERHPVLNKAGVAPKPKKLYHTSYPVYWIEVFNSAHQKWVPIDPLSTFTVNSPEKLEPPLSFSQNSLVYAIAFDDDLSAKDVTRRYAKAYNAKTRKFRVECTPDGDKWWKRALKIFKRSRKLDRDQVEDAALARKEASEGIPRNVQDFKDHPIYVLERHLKHNEIIHPMNQVGKVNVGTSMNPKMEPIYRRGEVHVVRSADKWYRMGRDVKDGEQPLKHAKPKKGKRLSIGPDETIEDAQEEIGAGLYAPFQTELYTPPPVIRGRIPRNAYGNLDLYVPSMCPPGGVHIRHKLASKAARIVGVDCADAVTGFKFKGRHGTAVVQGVVVAQEYAAAVEAVIEAMEYSQEEFEMSQRRSEALRMWRRFYFGLRIAQRVNAMEIDGETGPLINVQEEIEREDKELAEKEFAGGFFPDDGNFTEFTEPTAGYDDPPASAHDSDGGGGFILEESNESGGFVPEQHGDFSSSILAEQRLRARRIVPEEDSDDSGRISRETSPARPGSSSRDHYLGGGPVQSDKAADISGGFVPDDELADRDGGVLPKDESTLPGKSDDALPQAPYFPEVHPETKQEKEQAISEEVISGKIESAPPQVEHFLEVHPSADGEVRVQQPEIEPKLCMDGSSAATIDSKSTKDNVRLVAKEPSPPSPSPSPSDTGSLALEDPEDEDADPDWLIDAT